MKGFFTPHMSDIERAVELVQNALLIEDAEKADLLDLLQSGVVSQTFLDAVLRILGSEQEEFAAALDAMPDEEVAQLGMLLVQQHAHELREESSQEATAKAEEAESLLDTSL